MAKTTITTAKIEVNEAGLLAAIVKVFLQLSDGGARTVEFSKIRAGLGIPASQEHLLIERIQGHSEYLHKWKGEKRIMCGIVRNSPTINGKFSAGQKLVQYHDFDQKLIRNGPHEILKGPFLLYGRDGIYYWVTGSKGPLLRNENSYGEFNALGPWTVCHE